MIDHILVPLDGSSLAECVLAHVVTIARAMDARVTLLRVLEPTPTPGPSQFVDPLGWYINAAEARTYLDSVATRLQEAGLSVVEPVLLEGQAAERVIEYAREQAVDLIVLSSHGRSGLSGWNVSSIVLKIILRAYLPVMIVRAYHSIEYDLSELRYERLLLPLDCSQRAECVLPIAEGLARYYGAELLLVHIVSRPQITHRDRSPLTEDEMELVSRLVENNRLEATRYLKQLKTRLSDVDVQIRLVVSDHTSATLHDIVEQAGVDLVLLSAHGYSGEPRWPYGSTVVNFVGYGTTPLLIVQDLAPAEVQYTEAEIVARERKGH